MKKALAISIAALAISPAAADAHRLNVRPVQAAAIQAAAAIPREQLEGSPWLGKCFRHGNHFIKCRFWAVYVHIVEFTDIRNVFLCHAYVSAQAAAGVYNSVHWDFPGVLSCEQIAGIKVGLTTQP